MLALTQATGIQTCAVGNAVVPKNTVLFSRPQATINLATANTPGPPPPSKSHPIRASGNWHNFDFDDIPSDAFDSSPAAASHVPARAIQRSSAQNQNLRQTTLWDSAPRESRPIQSQAPAAASRPFRADLPPEVPTHHDLDHKALETWVYPLNLGEPRAYQFSIVSQCLFENTLVALPTGLGKTFIAATVMLNFVRWTKSAKVVFMAPTKPLASQQVQACLNIVGIPRSQATLLTGETAPALREAEWETKRLFFMTPQTLMNDLSKGYADPKSIALLVVDEAHRATGEYSYVKVIEFMRRFSSSFRVLALTATPGSSVEAVQDVIDNLGISRVEIRTEDSLDIRAYVHSRKIDIIALDPSDEIIEVKDMFSKALKPLVDKLSAQNIYFGRDPMSITTYGLQRSKNEWMAGPGQHAPPGAKFTTIAVFTILQSLAHAVKLLNFHGIKPFYSNLAGFRDTEEEKKGPGSKLRRQFIDNEDFQKMMTMVRGWLKQDTFMGHPKIERLCETLVNHFMDAGENSATRVIVFSEYRDSAEEIVRVLNRQPLISAAVFVGQADSKRSEGMKQKQQIETIERFKRGDFNVLVATSIGEEGLDIGQVDLIVCYDASASPIRMLQRMGRTGRKRAGNVVLLLMKGKEEEKYLEAKDNYEKMQQLISSGDRFAFRHDLSTRFIPRNIKPQVDKRVVDIPLENSQNPTLPEPKKSAAGLRRKATKKFHMPDGVDTGFTKASMFGLPAKQPVAVAKSAPAEVDSLVECPDLETVTLSKSQTTELNHLYGYLPSFLQSHEEDVCTPSLGAWPVAQRTLRRTAGLKHGAHTKRCVKLFKTLGKSQDALERYIKPYGETDTEEWRALPVPAFAKDMGELPRPADLSEDERSTVDQTTKKKRHTLASKPSTRTAPDPQFYDQDDNTEGEGSITADVESPPACRGRGRGRVAPRSKKSRLVAGHLEDMGDDCMRTSDMDESDGSDSGADLVGFVVDDDQATSSMRHRSTSPTTPDSSSHSDRGMNARHATQETPKPVKEKPFYVPMEFSQTQDTDEDMPDFATLVEKSRSAERVVQRASLVHVGLEDDDEEHHGGRGRIGDKSPLAKRRGRLILEDSDDNGDDD
ncbi:hypothetical protein B0T22DRAFT_417942 [Podospora appendiculata]|uniref:ATP-dependent DNA helicase n=1 Tax=Podospora appendiculata TaxID=314037 RepID=A0AAE1CHW4_9PEZI|nr:hypothetical protein B0T22DRAFT_417942 [Podospora appendiculata]